jgi:hypothetical protein
VINWERFAERVKGGTPVKDHWLEGVLIETYPYHALEINVEARRVFKRDDEDYEEVNSDRLRWQRTLTSAPNFLQPTLSCVDALMYYIDNHWLTFEEVMA